MKAPLSLSSKPYDLVVIGGGINGAGIARDAAGRGLSVLLCERDDLAQHTSSASTKLVHGGLRYLEYYEFGLVRKALREREVLLRSAPHIIAPLRFVMPHQAAARPAWMIRAGLFLYDHLAKRAMLPASQAVSLPQHVAGAPLKGQWRRGFEYSDGWVDDARLVVLNAVDAHEKGAHILTRTSCTGIERDSAQWRITLAGQHAGEVRAHALVNAAGPWAGQVAQLAPGRAGTATLRLIKGSHIVVPRLFTHRYAYIFQHSDKRIVFAIPYEQDFTLIGTTDLDYQGDPAQVAIDAGEVDYLCGVANTYFAQQIAPRDVVWTYSGVRPLLDDQAGDASAVTRDYRLECSDSGPPMLDVWGGKITTYRKLAEEALDMLVARLDRGGNAWTASAHLPGGDLGQRGPAHPFDAFLAAISAAYPWLPQALASRYARCYGSRMVGLLDGATSMAALGQPIVPGLYEREVRYLMQSEWACSADDILWRRTKQGLRCSAEDKVRLAQWLARALDGGSVIET
jgi:glycerol-3-phosphate dehydrogenase